MDKTDKPTKQEIEKIKKERENFIKTKQIVFKNGTHTK